MEILRKRNHNPVGDLSVAAVREGNEICPRPMRFLFLQHLLPRVEPGPLGEESQRESRRLLSSAASLPADLVAKWPIPSGYQLHHTVHKDHALPHFHGRLSSGEKLDNKSLGLSHN